MGSDTNFGIQSITELLLMYSQMIVVRVINRQGMSTRRRATRRRTIVPFNRV